MKRCGCVSGGSCERVIVQLTLNDVDRMRDNYIIHGTILASVWFVHAEVSKVYNLILVPGLPLAVLGLGWFGQRCANCWTRNNSCPSAATIKCEINIYLLSEE